MSTMVAGTVRRRPVTASSIPTGAAARAARPQTVRAASHSGCR